MAKNSENDTFFYSKDYTPSKKLGNSDVQFSEKEKPPFLSFWSKMARTVKIIKKALGKLLTVKFQKKVMNSFREKA